MINAGAITTHSLVGPESLLPAERVDRVVRGLSAFAGRRLEVDETVCVSDMENAHRNLGVAGGMIGALPGQVGIATFSPRLDRHGNSVRGVSLFERFSSDMGLHVMEVPPAARAVVRSNHVRGKGASAVRVLQAQGGIRFAGAERIVREFVGGNIGENRVVLDFALVSSIDDVARRMLLELARRLTLDGRVVYFVDPELILPDPDRGDGVLVPVIAGAEHLFEEPVRNGDGMFAVDP